MLEVMRQVCQAVQEDMGGAAGGIEVYMVPPPGHSAGLSTGELGDMIGGPSTMTRSPDIGFGPSLPELDGGVMFFKTNFDAQHLFPAAEGGTPDIFGGLTLEVDITHASCVEARGRSFEAKQGVFNINNAGRESTEGPRDASLSTSGSCNQKQRSCLRVFGHIPPSPPVHLTDAAVVVSHWASARGASQLQTHRILGCKDRAHLLSLPLFPGMHACG